MVYAGPAHGRQDGPQGRRDVGQVMDARTQKRPWKAALALAAGAALAVLFWRFLAPTLALAAGAAALAFLLCPICRRLEKHMRPGLAAAGCLLGALLSLAALLWLLAPALLSQLGDLAGALPAALDTLRGLGQRLGAGARELGLDAQLPQLDLRGLGDGALRFAAGTVSFAGGVVNAVSQISMAAVLSATVPASASSACMPHRRVIIDLREIPVSIGHPSMRPSWGRCAISS